MKELLSLPEATFSAEGSYNQEFHGRAFDEIELQLDSNVTASGGAAVPHSNGPLRIMGSPEVIQAQNTLIRADAIDLWHGSAFFDGGYPDKIASGSISSGNDADQLAFMRLKLSRVIPTCMINASKVKAFVRGQFGTLASVATAASAANVSAIAGTLRPSVVSTMRNPDAGFLRPRFTQAEIAATVASSNIQHVIRFEQDTYVRGFSIRAVDSSADADVDGLVRGLKAFVTDSRASNDVIRARWGTMRRRTQLLAGWTKDDHDRAAGWVFLPMQDEANPQLAGAKLFRNGDSITFEFDTSATVERGYTAVTPGTGDKIVLTTWAATPVAGTGDVGPQVRTISNPNVRRGRRRLSAFQA